MPGDISRDFAQSLSKLHYKVQELEKKNQQLETLVIELAQKVSTNEQQDAKRQRARVLQAAATQDADVIDQLLPQTTDLTELELLRMFRPVDPMQPVSIEIRTDLLDNFRQATPGHLPELIVQEEVTVVPYAMSEQYLLDSQRAMKAEIEKEMQKAAANSQAIADQKAMQNRNIMRKLSPLWRLPEENVWQLFKI